MDYVGLTTKLLHSKNGSKDQHGAPHTPIYNTTTFAFNSTADILAVVEGKKAGALYTRYGLNPSIFALEQQLALLEGAEAAWAFCSGMASEAALFMALGRKGVICLGDAYGGTLELIADQLPQLGIPSYMLLGSQIDTLEETLKKGAGIVFFETPTNPALEIFDIAAICKLAHQYGTLVAVDNTFASPINQQPLSLGADLVIHSATKYLGGHSDITAGALMGSKELLAQVWPWRKNLGQMIAPEVASLLSRSLRTLQVRVKQQNESAAAVANAMHKHSKIAKVLYPGLPDFPGHELAKKQMSGFGGMLSIEVAGSAEQTSKVADNLKLFALAPSLGGVESLVTQPSTTTHHGLTPEERKRRGISDSTLRLSVGLEDARDLIADLEQALSSI
jgi:cystathionine gamma-synthase